MAVGIDSYVFYYTRWSKWGILVTICDSRGQITHCHNITQQSSFRKMSWTAVTTVI